MSRPTTTFHRRQPRGPAAALPLGLILLYLLLVYLRPHEFVAQLESVPLLPMVLIAMVVALAITHPRPLHVPHAMAGIGLVLSAAAGLAIAGRVGDAVTRSLDLAVPLVLAAAIAISADTTRRLRLVAIVFVSIGVLLVFHGIQQTHGGFGWSGAQPVQRDRITYIGFLGDPNDLGRVFVVGLAFALHLAARGSLVHRALGAAAAGLLFYGVLLTESRGTYLGVLAVVAVPLIHRVGWAWSTLLVPPLLAALLVMAPARMERIGLEDRSTTGRLDAWQAGFAMLREHPWFGVGKGAFTEHHVQTAHNAFVQAFAELGLTGYFFWFALVAVTGWMLVRLARAATHARAAGSATDRLRDDGGMTLALTAAYAGLTVTSLFLSRAYEFTLYLLIGMIVAHYINMRAWLPRLRARRLWPLIPRLLAWMAVSIVALWAALYVLPAFG